MLHSLRLDIALVDARGLRQRPTNEPPSLVLDGGRAAGECYKRLDTSALRRSVPKRDKGAYGAEAASLRVLPTGRLLL